MSKRARLETESKVMKTVEPLEMQERPQLIFYPSPRQIDMGANKSKLLVMKVLVMKVELDKIGRTPSHSRS